MVLHSFGGSWYHLPWSMSRFSSARQAVVVSLGSLHLPTDIFHTTDTVQLNLTRYLLKICLKHNTPFTEHFKIYPRDAKRSKRTSFVNRNHKAPLQWCFCVFDEKLLNGNCCSFRTTQNTPLPLGFYNAKSSAFTCQWATPYVLAER